MDLLKSPAKINIFLDVTKIYKDGYHNIKSIFLETTIFDEIHYEISNNFLINDNLPDENNLITKAYKCFYQYTKFKPLPLNIKLIKNIPIGGGLGGGSSNAAAIFKMLNKLHNYPLSLYQLEKLSFKIGCDIPYFIRGKTQKIFGKGEILKKIKIKNFPLFTAMVEPDIKISTIDAYRWIDEDNLNNESYFNNKKFKMLQKGLIEGNPEIILNSMYNKFEYSVYKRHKELKELKDELLNCGFDNVLMSGSGSTLICYSKNSYFFQKNLEKIQKKGYKVQAFDITI